MSKDFDLDGVVPWGRSFEEYQSFFALTDLDTGVRILDCGGGPSSFNMEMTWQGFHVVSADPLYGLDGQTIHGSMSSARDSMVAGFAKARDRFVWRFFKSPEEQVAYRTETMQSFLNDYDEGRLAGRYIDASLPDLPFPGNAFDLALSSHFLFLYDHLFDLDFHLHAVRDMLRVGAEVRIFPLLDLGGKPSSLVEPLIAELKNMHVQTSIERVPYEFQKGGNQMLRVSRPDADD